MRKTRDLILIMLLLLPFSIIAQNIYYVSSSEGNDSNSGKSTGQAWKSLEKVNSLKPSPGDQILFKKGDQWEGMLTIAASGTSGNPIKYGSYGAGSKPMIYGSKAITGWTKYSGNIYKAKSETTINQLFLNANRMTLARYPNSGYLTISNVNNSTQLSCNQINGSINYLGATWTGRTAAWSTDTKVVRSSSGQTLTLSGTPLYSLDKGEGFFLCNKLEFLDQANEWYYDEGAKTVYLFLKNDVSPSSYIIRGSNKSNGVTATNKSYFTINDLVFLQFADNGISLDNCNHVKIDNCEVINPEKIGILLSNVNSNNNVIINTKIDGTNQEGIRLYGSNNLVENCEVLNVNLFENLGLSGIGGGNRGGAITINGNYDYDNPVDNNVVRYNRVIGFGVMGITFQNATNTIVEYNFLKDGCLMLDDGGAIYTYNANLSKPACSGSIVRYNIIDNMVGNKEGYNSAKRFGSGIYMDERSRDIKVEHNTITRCNGYGIYLHDTKNINVNNNIIYDAAGGFRVTNNHGGNLFTNNTIANIASTSYGDGTGARMVIIKPSEKSTLTSNNNTYIDHYRSSPFYRTDTYSYISFSEWKTISGQDSNSKYDGSKHTDGEYEKLFYNDTKQDKTFQLQNKSLKDILGTIVSGSITLKPFTSKILISSNFDQIKTENQQPSLLDHSFNLEGSIYINQSVGQVTASDPDEDQSLTYSIVEGNDNNEFSINPLTGQITANTDLNGNDNNLFNLVVKVTDNSSEPLSSTANVSISISNTEENDGSNNVADTTSPVISNFAVAANATTLTVSIESFEASDDVSVTSYSVTETNETPAEWSTTLPTSYTFTSEGNHILYAWAKDAAGNISSPVSANANVSLPILSSDKSEYRFEEGSRTTAFDTKGNADGTLINGVARTTGVSGQGVELDGSSYINLGDNFGDNIQNEVSISAWIKPIASTSGYQGIVMHGGPNFDSFALYINPESDMVGFKTTGTTSEWVKTNSPTLFDGNWHNITVIYNGSEKIIYLDNTILTKVNASGMIESGAGYNLLIGAGRDETPATLLYTGLIDEVRIFNYGLTTEEVGELFYAVENNNADQTDKDSNTTDTTDNQEPTITNQAPIIANQSFEITNIKINNEFVGQVVALDQDADQTLSFSITAGNEEGLFIIDSNSGQLFTNTAISKNIDKSVQLSVTATDNGQSPLATSATITVSINTVESNQRPVISNQTFEIENNYKSNKLIGQIISSDPDANQTLTYSIADGNDRFYIDPVTGELFTNKPLIINGNETIDLTVQVTDNGENALSANATITINLIAKSNLVNGEVNEHNKKRITLYFSGSLHQDNNLKSAQLTSDFTVNNKAVENVTISGSEIYLDVDTDFYFEDEIVVSYNKGANPIVDDSGNEIDEFSNYIVENNLPIDDKSMTTDVNVNIDGKVEVSFYPNPSNGLFTIKADNLSNDDCSILMYGMMGNLVAQKEVYASFGSLEEKVDMSHLSPGTYIINFICDNESTQSKLVIR